MIPGKRFTPDDIMRAAWRRRWWIAIPTVLVTIGAAAASLMAPERWRATALVQVLAPAVPNEVVQSTVGTRFRMEERLLTLQRAILTRPRLQKIVEDFNLYPELRKTQVMDTVIDVMGKDTVFDPVDQEIFRIGYTSNDPQTAYNVAKRLTDLVLEESTKDREGLANATQDFLQSQLDDAQKRLLEQEKKLSDYRTKYSGELPDQQAANLQVLNSAQQQLQQLGENLNRDRSDRLALVRQLERVRTEDTSLMSMLTPGAAKAAAELGTPAEQLDLARAELRRMELTLTPEHPDIQQAKRNIARLEDKVRLESRVAGKPARTLTPAEALKESRIADLQGQIEQIDRQILNKQAEEARLKSSIAEYRSRHEAAPLHEAEMTALTRDYKTIQDIYNTLLQKKESAKISANLEKGSIGERFKVLDPGRVPQKRLSPTRSIWTIAGFAIGLVIGLGIAGLLEFMDSSLRTDLDVEGSLGLPVLAMVPNVGGAAAMRAIAVRLENGAAAAGVVQGGAVDGDAKLMRLAMAMVVGAALMSFAASFVWIWIQGR